MSAPQLRANCANSPPNPIRRILRWTPCPNPAPLTGGGGWADYLGLVRTSDRSDVTGTAREWGSGGASPPPAANEDGLALHWTRWREAARDGSGDAVRAFARDAEADPAAAALLAAAFGNSPYLSRSLIADQAFARVLIEDGADAAFAVALEAANDASDAAGESMDAAMTRLRAAKRRAALAVGMADIAGVWPLKKVTAALSDFAEAALRAACRHLLAGQHRAGALELPDPAAPERGSGLLVLGMGKLGAHELNYSSDIDLIVLYDQDAVPHTGKRGLQQIFIRLARDLVRMMGEQTRDGYVFRTDLRLRPDPGSTPLALSVRAAEEYYRRAGRNWERAAMIKARAVAGDTERAEAFLASLAPFVWRRYLDFAAGQDIQAVKRQIDASRRAGGAGVAGHNVKLGRGGIREIEFFAQAQQLIWGGRTPALRVFGTLNALDALVAAGRVTPRAARELRSAYEFLRRLEHRLQMVNDEQTHSLPESEEGVADIAVFMGFESAAAFSDELLGHLGVVEGWFGALFEDKLAAASAEELVFPDGDDDPGTLEALARMGFDEPRRVSAAVRGWLGGRYPAMRGDRARQLLGELAPVMLRAFADSPHPGPALARFDRFLARLPDGVRLFSLLAAHPELFGLVAEIMGAAPRLAAWLTGHPGLLDSVLGRDFTDLHLPDDAAADEETVEALRRGLIRLFYAREFTAEEMSADLAAEVRRAEDFQDRLDAVRRWANDRVFQIGVHMLRGLLPPVEAGRPLSDIADVCIGALLPAVEEEFAARHGRIPGGRVAVVAFGKLGAREMTVSSDLDLLFLYDHDPGAARSDGARALAPSDYYARLCRRLIAAVSVPAREGKLYDVDMRLRPSGNAGPIACSREAFAAYQRAEAWTWEHQALTRARVVYAEGGLGAAFDEVKRAVLTRPREDGALAAEIAGMRGRIRDEHGSGGAWSIRDRRGGLMDAEFIAQFLQLSAAARRPEILAGDTISVFEAAGAHGVVDADTARELAEATRLWRNLQGILRLTVEGEVAGEEAMRSVRGVVGQAGGKLVFDALVESMDEAAARVTRHFDTLLAAG